MSISIFGFEALWSPYFLAINVLVLVAYYAVNAWRQKKVPSEKAVTVKEASFFTGAVVLLYVLKGSPIDVLGHLLFSWHMTQMAIVYIFIVPLFIIGLPNWLAKEIIEHRYVRPWFSFLTRPLIALFTFTGVFSIYHIPLVFDVVKTDVTLHFFMSTLLFLTSFFMYWPLLNHYDEQPALDGLKKVGYIFANGMLLTPACALIIFADNSLYGTYTDPALWSKAMELCVPAGTLSQLNVSSPELFYNVQPEADQRLGGVIMKIIQEVVYGYFLAVVFYEWVRREKKREATELAAYEQEIMNKHY